LNRNRERPSLDGLGADRAVDAAVNQLKKTATDGHREGRQFRERRSSTKRM
jgi:hypothetical protein